MVRAAVIPITIKPEGGEHPCMEKGFANPFSISPTSTRHSTLPAPYPQPPPPPPAASKFLAEKNSGQSDHEKYCGVGRSSLRFHPTRFNPTA
jgi:hypothetical protein